MKRLLRKIHRWLGLLMALQILAWFGSGLYFSWYPIAEIRGEHLTRAPDVLGSPMLEGLGSPDGIVAALNEHFDEAWDLSAVELAEVEGRARWLVRGDVSGKPFSRLVEPGQARVVPMLPGEDSASRASRWLLEPAEAVSSEWVAPGSGFPDFRGRESAAWRVDFDGEEPVSLYIDPWTGELLARRTTRWRLFDFFWMLHVMDYDTRDDFNHPLLQLAASLGLLIVLSGVVYWFMSSRLFRRRKSRPASAS